MASTFKPSPNIVYGDTVQSGSTHQFTGSVSVSGTLTLNGVAVSTGGGGGSGDVSGPGSATDNAIVRFNGTGGKTIQNSSVTIDDSNNMTGIVAITTTGNTTLGNASTDYHKVSGTLAITGSVIQGGGNGLDSNVYEGRDQVSLGYAGEDASGNEEGSQYHFIIDNGQNFDSPTINIGTIDGATRPGDESSTINIGTSGSSVTINGGEAGTGANPITLGGDQSAVSVGLLTASQAQIAGDLTVTGPNGGPLPANLYLGTLDENNFGKITLIDGNNATGSAIIRNSSGSEGLILSSSRAVSIYAATTITGSIGVFAPISSSHFISASAFYGPLYRGPATAGQVLFTDNGGITNSDAGLMYAPGSDTLYIPNITTLGSVDFTINTTAGQDAKLYLGDDAGTKALFFYNNSGGQVALIDAAGRISGSQFYGDGSNLTNLQASGTAADSIKIGNNNGAVAVGSLNISFGGTVLGQGSQAIGPGSPKAIAAGASAIGSGSISDGVNAIALGTFASASAASAVALGQSSTGSAANAVAVGNTSKATAAAATALGNAATSSAAGAIAIGSSATTAGDYSIVMGDTISNITHKYVTVVGARASAGGASAVAIGSGSNAGAADTLALGQSAAATAANSIAIGEGATAGTETNTIAVGKGASSTGTGSVVFGAGASTTGDQSVAVGPVNTTTANYTTVVGYNNNASVNYSIIIGDTSVASAANAVAVGQKVKASGADSIAIGQFATASAANTIAIGSGSQAIEANTVVFGNSTQPVRLFISGAAASTYFSASIDTSIQATCSFYNIFNYGLTANSVITASNPIAGASYLFFLRQPSAGSKTALFSGFKWAGGSAPTLSTDANAVDIVSGVSDGEFIYADITKAFS